jgi:pyruvate ferredoxin oxidoreductase beta subunit
MDRGNLIPECKRKHRKDIKERKEKSMAKMNENKEKKILGIPAEEYFASGHRACAGCGQALSVRLVLKAAGKDTIVCNNTGCLEVFSSPYPQTSWKLPWIHVAFENAAAVASGIERSLKHQGKKLNILAIGGDGGTFDIGLQALSGAAERGHDFCYVCFDNGAYMNTGIQRSGATPKYAATTTTPHGSKVHGKPETKKDMPFIMAAHRAYVATASAAFPQDLVKKVQKGLAFNGPAYIQIDSVCTLGWGVKSDLTIKLNKLAFDTRLYPLFEIENGVLTNLMKPSKNIPVEECLKLQKRFSKLHPEEIKEIQREVDAYWNRLMKLEETKVRLF